MIDTQQFKNCLVTILQMTSVRELSSAEIRYYCNGVGGSCAEHLTVESYTIIISLQSYLLLLVFDHPLTLSL